jgi:hypothetical protein
VLSDVFADVHPYDLGSSQSTSGLPISSSAGVLLAGILRRGRSASHVGAESGDGECG